MGRMRGYLPNRWPSWFDPLPLDLTTDAFGPFPASRPLTGAGDVIAVGTPGHTTDHLSVVVAHEGVTYFLAGDASYNERLMLTGRIDGVSADDNVAGATLGAIRRFATDRPTVYLPTHDPESAVRLAGRQLVVDRWNATKR
jgi:glyoxylase-like metal-dependent hydrolase (beta-lactamase superfamily II)